MRKHSKYQWGFIPSFYGSAGIYAAMRGREKLYGQMRDFLDLLQLQRTPPTLEEQRQESARLSQYYGVPISEQDITWMTDDECEAAIARLSSFVFPDAPLLEA